MNMEREKGKSKSQEELYLWRACEAKLGAVASPDLGRTRRSSDFGPRKVDPTVRRLVLLSSL